MSISRYIDIVPLKAWGKSHRVSASAGGAHLLAGMMEDHGQTDTPAAPMAATAAFVDALATTTHVADVVGDAHAGADGIDLVEGHVRFSVATRPVVAHLAPSIAHERAVQDENGRANGREVRNRGVEKVAGRARHSLGEVSDGVSLCH